MQITEELLIPSKEDLIEKLLQWDSEGLLNTHNLLERCLQCMSDRDVENLYSLLAPAFEEEDEDEDLRFAEYIEDCLSRLPLPKPVSEPALDPNSPACSFRGFQF
jgi:hypothetical protein